MKTVFILNPSAGKGRGSDKLKEKINRVADRLGHTVGVYTTKGPGDAEKFAQQFCIEAEAEETGSFAQHADCVQPFPATQEKREQARQASAVRGRLIACGGDGTFNEVLNGVMQTPHGAENVSVGLVPTGTGNDFVRNFFGADFSDIEAQLLGEPQRCDAIRYSGWIDGKMQTRYCANMFNIGFDCNVVDTTARMKKYPLINGSFAYLLSVGLMFIQKKGAKLRVELDGRVAEDGPVLLTAIANGGYCGGGVYSAPQTSLTDGLMHVNIIYDVKRLEFLQKFPYYAKGTYPELDGIERIIYSSPCQTARITPLDGIMRLCTDGEIVDAGTVDFTVAPGAFQFLVPRGAAFGAEKGEGDHDNACAYTASDSTAV